MGFDATKTNPSLGHIVGGHFHGDAIAHNHTDLVLAHISRNISIDGVVGIIQTNFKLLVGKALHNNAATLYCRFFCHNFFFWNRKFILRDFPWHVKNGSESLAFQVKG